MSMTKKYFEDKLFQVFLNLNLLKTEPFVHNMRLHLSPFTRIVPNMSIHLNLCALYSLYIQKGHYIFLTSTDHMSLDVFIVGKLLINSPICVQ